MEPYYVSWQDSSHKDVSCIKCHFPPGAGEKVRGKMLGLVQLAKYVTGDRRAPPGRRNPRCQLPALGLPRNAAAVGPRGLPWNLLRPHTRTCSETRRGKQLRCTSCHGQIVQGKHMAVTPSTCFLCHFKDERFNEGLGACTRCHQIPDKEFDLGGGVNFTHELAYERGVDCANCHGDLIRGNGEVPHERCTVCHNREEDLKRSRSRVPAPEARHRSQDRLPGLPPGNPALARQEKIGTPPPTVPRATPTTTTNRSRCSRASEPSASPRNPAA